MNTQEKEVHEHIKNVSQYHSESRKQEQKFISLTMFIIDEE